ncbi:hypothetical protein [Nocardia seriolae]|uniref:Uncharacterized protein n=2 Tax=Nocardia seriolae TaxID=37332 RepID=A0ABC9Z7A5_9NOCA|nr:hypothetical protein [Nocardia seriolae]WKY52107.1 hypothetical protein Q5P07_35315 [Nocardia seriolae]BEK84772.1 hypothetical protein NSERKGN1266_07230 [Nocardia seriolae]BEK92726.1 hypothetical protein NSER024013_06320 [Nocardia seriolae]GAM51490.1 hypothetical protein NS07_v2contig00278-0002 [Nocardia seriolae]GAP33481.1 hypothetical protein NSK11_contig00282-0002 [Nocardia seriolae]
MASPDRNTGIRAVINGPKTGYSGQTITLDGTRSQPGSAPIRYHWTADAAFMASNPNFAEESQNPSVTLVLPEVPLRIVRRVGLTVYGAANETSPQALHSIAIKPTPAS